MSAKNESKRDDVTTLDQFSFLDSYVGKDCVITLTGGRTMYAKIIKISAYELMIEEGKRRGEPIQKLLFKHAVAKIEEKVD